MDGAGDFRRHFRYPNGVHSFRSVFEIFPRKIDAFWCRVWAENHENPSQKAQKNIEIARIVSGTGAEAIPVRMEHHSIDWNTETWRTWFSVLFWPVHFGAGRGLDFAGPQLRAPTIFYFYFWFSTNFSPRPFQNAQEELLTPNIHKDGPRFRPYPPPHAPLSTSTFI